MYRKQCAIRLFMWETKNSQTTCIEIPIILLSASQEIVAIPLLVKNIFYRTFVE